MRKTRLAIPALMLTLALGGSVAFIADAQPRRPEAVDLTTMRPPLPQKQDKPPFIMPWLLITALVAAAVGANMIPSKRGHQD